MIGYVKPMGIGAGSGLIVGVGGILIGVPTVVAIISATLLALGLTALVA
ncbi:hypothetical protein [Mycobacterium phage WXIN]|nr:hypothetical protein [Mycobacterium phage WXIN]